MYIEGTPAKCPNSNKNDSYNEQLHGQNHHQDDLFPKCAEMPHDDFHRLMSVHYPSYSDLFSDEVFENNDWSKYYNFEYLKMSYGEGLECSDEGIQSASNLKYSGTVELDLSGSDNLVWVSTEDTSNYGIGHTIDVDSDKDSMVHFPHFFIRYSDR